MKYYWVGHVLSLERVRELAAEIHGPRPEEE